MHTVCNEGQYMQEEYEGFIDSWEDYIGVGEGVNSKELI
jgi:hypothetical protein